MRYTYDLQHPKSNARLATSTSIADLWQDYVRYEHELPIVVEYDNTLGRREVYWTRAELENREVELMHEMSLHPKKQEDWKPFSDGETDIELDTKKETAKVKAVNFKKDHINPSHYQDFLVFSIGEPDPNSDVYLQWIEVEFRKPYFRANPEAVKGALYFQIDKYLGRLGQKDASIQELKKAKWYLEYLIAYEANGNKPLLVKNIQAFQK
jgi:hypothetical protein